MKKISFILLFIPVIVLSGCNRGADNVDNSYDDVSDLIEEHESDKRGVRGSCNSILEKSACVDFVGSVFTEERMKLSCVEGQFSKNTCPYSELGGCQATPGTIGESIVWSYSYGGQPLSAEEASYAMKACNATGVSKWVTPDEINKIK